MDAQTTALPRPTREQPATPWRAIARKLPWNTRRGRFSLLKAATLVLVLWPALDLLRLMVVVGVSPRAFRAPVEITGRWAIWFLLLALAVTPARRLLGWTRLILVRRMLGLAALGYTLLHVVLYAAEEDYNLAFVTSELMQREYLTVGLAATLGLVMLGVTSTDGMVRRIGTLAWRRLHRVVYVIGFAAFLHYYMASASGAVFDSGLFLWLIGYRIMAAFGWRNGLVPLLVLAAATAVTAALIEAGWTEIIRPGIGLRLLVADVTGEIGVRPEWWLLADGILVALAAEAWRRIGPVISWQAVKTRVEAIGKG